MQCEHHHTFPYNSNILTCALSTQALELPSRKPHNFPHNSTKLTALLMQSEHPYFKRPYNSNIFTAALLLALSVTTKFPVMLSATAYGS